MKIILHVWRQKNAKDKGGFVRYEAPNVNSHMSFLEMLDIVNEGLIEKGEEPIAFEHDCREGICGCCGLVINGVPHGPQRGGATCQLHMRHYKNGDEIWTVRVGTQRILDVFTLRKLCDIGDEYADGFVHFTLRSNLEYRKGLRPPRLDPDLVAVLVVAHV